MTLLPFVAALAMVPPIETPLVYKDADGTECKGIFVRPATRNIVPVMIIVHDWNGPDNYELTRARMVAEQWGMGALVADIYGGARPTTPAENGAEARKYYSDNALFRKRLQAAVDAVKARGDVDASSIGAMGYCFGGTAVLEMARMGADVKAVVSFHGGLSAPNPAAGTIGTKIMLHHAADDPAVPKDQLVGFLAEMTAAKADYRMVIYNLAVHPFTVIGGPSYNEQADKRSWETTTEFLKEVGLAR